MSFAESWSEPSVVFAGGLVGVGFGADSDLLLIVSHDGRAVIDCSTGQKVARDRNSDFDFDQATRMVGGIGPLAGQQIFIAGTIFGGELARSTADGWSIVGELVNEIGNTIEIVGPAATPLKVIEAPDIRACGFSPTGQSLVVATGSDATIYSRT